MKHAIILGGGATGLVTAYLLAREGLQVTLMESEARVGGLMNTFEVGDDQWLECFYHHFFTHDVELRWLLQQLGLDQHLVFRPTTMGLLLDGTIYPFDGIQDALSLAPLPLVERLRWLMSSGVLVSRKRLTHEHAVGCLNWLRRWAGEKATRAIWQPMLRSKFGEDAERVPVAWLAGRLRQRTFSRKMGVENLGYLKGSLRVLMDRLMEELEKMGVIVHTRSPVTSLLLEKEGVVGVTTPAGDCRADLVVSTVPTSLLAGLVPSHSELYAGELRSIKYVGAVCVVLRLKKALSSVYWLNVADDGFDFAGVIEHTNFVPAAEYGGKHFAYLSRYVALDDPFWSIDDMTIVKRQVQQLGSIFKRNIGDEVEQHWVFRAPFAAIIPEVDFPKKIPQHKTPVRGLYMASQCHIYPDERSVNNSIRVARNLVRSMGFFSVSSRIPDGRGSAATFGL